jgi:hypothetical protein
MASKEYEKMWEKKRRKWQIAEYKSMLYQLEREPIKLFNAKKSLYVPIEDNFLGKAIRFLSKIMIKRQLRSLNE